MTDSIMEIAKQVPALAVLAGVVWFFLKAGSQLLISHANLIREMQSVFVTNLKDIQVENVEARALSREVIRENTIATKEMNQTLAKLLIATESGYRK